MFCDEFRECSFHLDVDCFLVGVEVEVWSKDLAGLGPDPEPC
jgi:hypothetical protein